MLFSDTTENGGLKKKRMGGVNGRNKHKHKHLVKVRELVVAHVVDGLKRLPGEVIRAKIVDKLSRP